ncbi:MAG: DUF1800 domain-containing protein [Acidimicrobiales bacterium]
MPSDYHDVAHLLRRAGFGGLPNEIAALTPLAWSDVVDEVLAPKADPGGLPSAPNLHPYTSGWSERYTGMVWYWLERARRSPNVVREKMVLFWHGHLCSAIDKVYDHRHLFEQHVLFRNHGMGDYQTLLEAVSLQPAMLWYLDNWQNDVEEPNENFARELMELFTLGAGNGYTEHDVRELARAWTGHGLNDRPQNENNPEVYQFHSDRHDYGNKTIFGDTRNWDGPATISHILRGPRARLAAEFMVTKLWTFFAYPDPEAAVVDALADVWTASDRNITEVLRALFNRPEFRSERARNGLVRSPIEYAVAIMRHLGLGCEDLNPQWTLSRMGQAPFNPPNVSGWRPNEYWISPTAHWGRHSLASGARWRIYNIEGGVKASLDSATSAEEAVDRALAQFGIDQPTAATRNELIRFAEATQQPLEGGNPPRWSRTPGLILLTPLTPDFQLA